MFAYFDEVVRGGCAGNVEQYDADFLHVHGFQDGFIAFHGAGRVFWSLLTRNWKYLGRVLVGKPVCENWPHNRWFQDG